MKGFIVVESQEQNNFAASQIISAGSNHICPTEVSGYPSVVHFLIASTWTAGYLRALV